VSVRRAVGSLLVVAALGFVTLGLAGVASGAVARSAAAAKVNVTFNDTSFSLSSVSLNAGKTTFVVTNRGRQNHAFEISGPGLTGARTAKLAAGKSAKLTVTLLPGAYMLSDPVGLSAYNVQYLDVAPAEVVTATGNSSVVAAPVTLPPMCGVTYTP
jgi:plastocyanin